MDVRYGTPAVHADLMDRFDRLLAARRAARGRRGERRSAPARGGRARG